MKRLMLLLVLLLFPLSAIAGEKVSGTNFFVVDNQGWETHHWENLSGTGKFAGMTGQGTYVSKPLPDGRHMSEWEGEVTLAE